MLFKHSHTKYTVSILSTSLPYWYDIIQTKTKFFAQRAYNKHAKKINPTNTHLCLTKITVYGRGSMIQTEELACTGAKVNDIIKI